MGAEELGCFAGEQLCLETAGGEEAAEVGVGPCSAPGTCRCCSGTAATERAVHGSWEGGEDGRGAGSRHCSADPSAGVELEVTPTCVVFKHRFSEQIALSTPLTSTAGWETPGLCCVPHIPAAVGLCRPAAPLLHRGPLRGAQPHQALGPQS